VTDASTPANVTIYGYDTESNLKTIQDASGNITKFDYFPAGQLKLTTFPSTLTESYTYDSDNNLKTKTDRKGQMITYTYVVLPTQTRLPNSV
jgi:YD repeat-containing protein